MKKILISVLVVPIVLASCTSVVQKEEVHLHAGFQVYINDVLQDYSAPEQMYFSPCGSSDEDHDSLEDKVHHHDEVGDVAHVHSAGMTWKDLLDSRSVKIPDNTALEYYRNGLQAPNLLEEEIQDKDTAIFFIGTTTDKEEKLKRQIPEERIHEVEWSKENCGS